MIDLSTLNMEKNAIQLLNFGMFKLLIASFFYRVSVVEQTVGTDSSMIGWQIFA